MQRYTSYKNMKPNDERLTKIKILKARQLLERMNTNTSASIVYSRITSMLLSIYI